MFGAILSRPHHTRTSSRWNRDLGPRGQPGALDGDHAGDGRTATGV